MKYDFSGYATKNDLKCSDGRIIRRDAFRENDGTVVPLVWQHKHDDPFNTLGHALLENRQDGVYAYCSLNESEPAQHAKILIEHGDISSMSIFANRLKQKGSDVVHGVIREVSLVFAGANPGATIENTTFAHSDGSVDTVEDEAIIHADSMINTLQHADDAESSKNQNGSSNDDSGSSDEKTIEDVINSMTEEQKNVMYFLIARAAGESDEDIEHADSDESSEEGDADGKTIQDIFDSMTEEQKNVVYFLVDQAAQEADLDEEDVEHSEDEGDFVMKYNVFDGTETDENTLSHDEMMAALADGPNVGSLKKAFLQHGIEDIELLFPEAKTLTPTPEMITRQMSWVSEVWNALKKVPFSRIKSVAADLTEDDARAKGYIKGGEKVEEVFGLLTRVTTPQTVYKKQALDRDDIIDITDFDVVAWLKQEMRLMLDEELSRAVMVGDGRLTTSKDKIKEDNIRPIYQDADLYTIHWDVTVPSSITDVNDKSNYLVDQALRSRKEYKGSGSPAFYASVDVINDMLLARDKVGRRMYNTMEELASALRVSKIVEVPVFEGVTRTDADNNKHELVGLIVNLADYSLGTDRGGEINFFDDFDIDFNKEKYLMETRVSGALTHPYSAIALEKSKTNAASFEAVG